MNFCQCDYPEEEKKGDIFFCRTCKNPIECEICGLLDEDIKPATHRHIDYLTCQKHETIAINNVASR
jgi:hypothetical protein